MQTHGLSHGELDLLFEEIRNYRAAAEEGKRHGDNLHETYLASMRGCIESRDALKHENRSLKNKLAEAERQRDEAQNVVDELRAEVERLKRELVKTRSLGVETLLLVNLSAEDYAKFEAHPFPYSGSTGAGAAPELYGGLAPYIATYLNEIHRAMHTFGWKEAILSHEAGQWRLRSGAALDQDRKALLERWAKEPLISSSARSLALYRETKEMLERK
jgi:hypothetical protein